MSSILFVIAIMAAMNFGRYAIRQKATTQKKPRKKLLDILLDLLFGEYKEDEDE